MKFYKMQGAGNDYIYLDCMESEPLNPEKLSRRLSDRHFSVGGDGLILLCPSDKADFRMRMFNSDGSEGKMCGNGIRCAAKLAHDMGYVKGNFCTVETLAGVKKLQLFFGGAGKVNAARVDMGKPVLEGEKIPSSFVGKTVVGQPLEVGGEIYKITLVSMGNPHCVVFVDDFSALDLPAVGKKIEYHASFPERINVEFVKTAGKNRLEMRVWERGTGETLACGTGACAAATAAALNGFCDAGEEISVLTRGGELKVTYTEDSVWLYGGAELVFSGEIEL